MTDVLAHVDRLPPMCALHCERDGDRVRFVAVNARGHMSLPSGWFSVADAPIYLAWDAFDFGT